VTVTWDDEVDDVLAADLTAALGYRTPAGGVVVQSVAPIGLRDREAGTIGFTTSLGFSKKLERIERDPRVAMAFHAREHGRSDSTSYVLVQGRARVVAQPSEEQRERVRTQATAYLGAAREGWFWDRWLQQYYVVRVPVDIEVDRVVTWSGLDCAGSPRVEGEALPMGEPDAQSAPKKGTGPRLNVDRAARRLRGTDHTLIGYAGVDGRPVVLPVDLAAVTERGLELTGAAALPAGGRRAGLLGHSYRPQLIGLETRQYTGWLQVSPEGRSIYAPHTEVGYKAPANKTLLLLLNGALAKRGVRAAKRAQKAG
jgi:nitroimidazol reductase NimA-like FMN-containing flavoprotein (pyridoxamine 5'-phosphate oxidase superfamily)